jgi:hypothetical protein
MANTYSLIEAKTLGSSTASVTFTSIPQTYTDLLLFTSCRSDRGAARDGVRIEPNSLSTNQTMILLNNVSGSVSSSTDTTIFGGMATGSTATASTFGNSSCYITNYTSSNYKAFSVDGTSENNSTDIFQLLTAALWSSSSALTELKVLPNIGPNWVSGSTFYLYGIKNS